MKRSLLSVLVASSVIAFGACAGEEEAAETELDTVEEVAPAPAPAPAPVDSMAVDTMAVDTGAAAAPTTGQ